MRVSYDKETRERAKAESRGLITLDIVRASGSRSTLQIVASKAEVRRMDRMMLKLIDGARTQ